MHSINVNCDRLEILVQKEPPQSRQRQHLYVVFLEASAYCCGVHVRSSHA